MARNFIKGVGRLSTDRYDFENHVNGTDNRHNASSIDLDNSIIISGNTSTNVNSAISDISTFINNLSLTGQGFITVGDGYDTYQNANGTVNFDTLIPSLDTLLNPLFTSIINYQDDIAASASTVRQVLPGYERIKDGGFIVIKAGTYIIKNTITVPAGFTIIGENFGTKLINATSLDTSVVPVIPKVSPTPAPLFRIKRDQYRQSVDAAVDQTLFSTFPFIFSRETKFVNLTISDNFVEPTQLGDVYYLLPQNNTTSTPLIIVEEGANFTLENSKILGRVTYSGVSVNNVTSHVIKTDNTTPITNGTILNIKNCFIDGFSVPILLTSKGGTNDYFIAENNNIKFYGYLNSDFTLPENNSCFNITVCNSKISNNYIYGNIDSMVAAIYLSDVVSGTVNTQGKSKILFSNNNIALNKSSNTVLTPTIVRVSATVSSNTDKFILVNANNLFNKYEVYVNNTTNSPQFYIDTSNVTIETTSANITTDSLTTNSSSIITNGDIMTVATTTQLNLGTSGNLLMSADGTLDISTNSSMTIDTSGNDGNLDVICGDGIFSVSSDTVNLVTNNKQINIYGELIGDTTNSDPLRFGRNTVSISGGGTITLTSSQYNKQIIELTGTTALTSVVNVNVVLPALAGYAKLISNKSTGNFRVIVKTPSGNGVYISQNSAKWVFCDGTDIKSGTAEEREISVDANTVFLYRCEEKYEFPFLGIINSGVGTSADLTPSLGSSFGSVGLFNRSLRFRGTTTEYFSGDVSTNTFPNDAVSISCWVRPGDLSTGTTYRLWGKARTDVANSIFDLVIFGTPGRIIGILKRSGVGSVDTIDPLTECNISAGVWNHIALTYDGSFLNLYINGILAKSDNLAGTVDWAQPGQWTVGAYPFDDSASPVGLICDIRADDVVRDEEYYAEMYRRGILSNAY